MKRLAAIALILALVASVATAQTAERKGKRIKPLEFTLAVSLVGFSAADTAITIHGTRDLGMTEMNGLMRPFLEGHHYAALWAIQAAGCAGIIWACHGLINHDDKTVRIIGYAALVAVNLGRAYCVYSNLRTHARAR